jgi:hypothetical protein
MIDQLNHYITYLDSFMLILLTNRNLDDEIKKMSLNQKLEKKLVKEEGYAKVKVVKI